MESLEYQIVVARYNENINYLSLFKDIMIVYNKGNSEIPSIFNSISLPNVGRESHTYLHHIIENYHHLPDKILFFQGNPRDHVSEDFFIQIYDFHFSKNDFHNFAKHVLTIEYEENRKQLKEYGKLQIMKQNKIAYVDWVNHHVLDCPLVNVMRKIYGEIEPTKIKLEFIPGANFGVSKERILQKPRTFYQDCLNVILQSKNRVNPDEGHSFERLWKYIFMNS